MLSTMTGSARKRFSATRSTAVKNMLNSCGASTRPCRRPCPTSTVSEHSPSSSRTHACMLSWNWRMAARFLHGTPKRARTTYRSRPLRLVLPLSRPCRLSPLLLSCWIPHCLHASPRKVLVACRCSIYFPWSHQLTEKKRSKSASALFLLADPF